MVALAGTEVCEVMVEALPSEQFKLLKANSPEEFHHCLRIMIPDLIVLDLRHPVEAGLKVLCTARLVSPQVPLLTVAEPDLAGADRISVMSGTRGVLFKPLDPKQLLRRINKEVPEE